MCVHVWESVCMYVRVCVCVYVRECVCMYMRECGYMCACHLSGAAAAGSMVGCGWGLCPCEWRESVEEAGPAGALITLSTLLLSGALYL